jgi:hypothetical protein
MGNNSSKWDSVDHMKSRTTKQLKELKAFWEARITEHDRIAREQLWLINAEIAVRIGIKRKT